MSKVWNWSLAACVALISSGVVAQEYTFRFTGEDTIAGPTGSVHEGEYLLHLAHSGASTGAQGWSVGVEVLGGRATLAATAETEAAGFFMNPFLNTSVIDPANNAGRQGVVSAVVLCIFDCPAGLVLPPNTSQSILRIGTEFTIGDQSSTGGLAVTSGLRGGGQPVDVVITEAAGSPAFATEDLDIALNVQEAPPEYTFRFTGDETVSGAPGSVQAREYLLHLAHEGAGPGAQGWSVGAELTGGVATLAATAETEAAGFFMNPFLNTSVIDPANNAGRQGVVSAVVLCIFDCPPGLVLPPNTSQSILRIGTEFTVGEEPSTGSLAVASGLRGGGQPVDVVITESGGSPAFATEDLAITIEPAAGLGPYMSGDANDDGKVNIADPVWIINEIFRQGPSASCQIASDANRDNGVDLADAMFVISYHFGGGPPPAGPFPDCDVTDPADAGDLTCDGTSCP